MLFDEFALWLANNPTLWDQIELPFSEWDISQVRLPGLPTTYRKFLVRFGSIALFDRTRIFLGPQRILAVLDFMRDLNQPEEDITFDHLFPFCDRRANDWYFCFDGETIVEFDPLDPFSIENVVASSLEDFLSQTILR